jgi:hypothetical protein
MFPLAHPHTWTTSRFSSLQLTALPLPVQHPSALRAEHDTQHHFLSITVGLGDFTLNEFSSHVDWRFKIEFLVDCV